MSTITLKSNRVIPLSDVTLDVATQTFRYGVADVSYALTREQMQTFSGFDVTRANAALSDARRGPSGGSTSVLGNFVTGIGEDVSAIGFGVRDFVAGKEGATSDLRKLIYVVAIGGLLYLGWKLATAIKSK